MANDIDQNPWILDTAGVITTDRVRIAKIRWIGVDAAGDDLVVQHADGTYLWTAKALAGDATNDIDYELPVDNFDAEGLKLTTLDSGKVEVWYR